MKKSRLPRLQRANQILARYAAGERNFQDIDLTGLVFKNQHLNGANFSRADIRGTDFSGAQLVGAKFKGARLGLGTGWRTCAPVFAIVLGLLSGFLSTRVALPLVSQEQPTFVSGMAVVAILVFLGLTIRAFGLLKGLAMTLGIMALIGTLLAMLSIGLNSTMLGFTLLAAVDSLISSVGVIGTLCILFAVAQAMRKDSKRFAVLAAVAGALSIPLMAEGPIADNLGRVGTGLAVGIAIAIVYFCWHISTLALTGDERHALIQSLTIAMLTRVGTQLKRADLTEADFTEASLGYTDFRAHNLDYTRWDGASQAHQSRWGAFAMGHLSSRQLMITRKFVPFLAGRYRRPLSLVGVNLSGTDLSLVDLIGADLTGATLINARLCGANLAQSNLRLVNALGTDFSRVQITGSCIEGWSIDETTCLDNVECDFIYRLGRKAADGHYRERQPSSGCFEPGDFTRLFRVMLNTVELIFRHGIDRQALVATLEKVQKSYSEAVQLQGIEEKEDGFIKVTLRVPENIQKAELHQDFKQIYKAHLDGIEARYEAQLKAAQQQIQHYQTTTTELTAIVQQLSEHRLPGSSQASGADATCDGWVILTFWDGSLEQGYPVTADMQVAATALPFKFHASLPPAPELVFNYQQWQLLYRQAFGAHTRIQFEPTTEEGPLEMTNVSRQELEILAQRLSCSLQTWLQSASFRSIADKLREKFLPEQNIRVIIQTEDAWLRRLPWHLWNFLDDYPNANVTLSGMFLEATNSQKQKMRDRPRVLAVIGNSNGININVDQQLLQEIDRSKVDVVFLKEPCRQTFHEYLWDQKGWDVFYFSGHSASHSDGQSGIMQLNLSDKVSIEELQFSMKQAVHLGLKLAVLNSCDGLGLAKGLCQLKLPQVVVMKEPVPDQVAHQFLDYFLASMTRGNTFYTAFCHARQQLSSLEDQYPYASWLPVLFQTTVLLPQPIIKQPAVKKRSD